MIRYLDPEEFRDIGYLQEANRQFFHPLGLALELDMESGAIQVWDYRIDPEGIRFEGVDLESKADRIQGFVERRMKPRKEALGYWIQPAKP